jgi:hypothetical protein
MYTSVHFNLLISVATTTMHTPWCFQVKKMVHAGQEVIVISGSHSLHEHEKLAVAVSKAMRSHSLHETKNDGRFHVRTKTYLDGAILKEVYWSWI